MTTANEQVVDDGFVYNEEEVDFDAMARGGAGELPSKLKEGLNILRVLPPFGEAQNPNSKYRGFIYAELYVHWLKFKSDTGKDIYKVVRCSKTQKDDPCEACEKSAVYNSAFEKLVSAFSSRDDKKNLVVAWEKMPGGKDGDFASKARKISKAAQDIKAQRHYYYNVFEQDGRVRVKKMSKTAGQDLNGEIKKCTTLGYNPVSLKAGCFMVVEMTKTGPLPSQVKTKAYPLQISTNEGGRIKSETALAALEPSIMKGAKDLYSLYPRLSAEAMKRALAGDLSVFDKPKSESVPMMDDAAVDAVSKSIEEPTPPATETKAASKPEEKPVETAPATPAPVTAEQQKAVDDLLAEIDL